MGAARSLATLALLYSLSGASALRASTPAAPLAPVLKLLNKDVTSDERYNKLKYVAGNCGRLTVRNGLAVGESIKVTSNGWTDEDRDFVVDLVSDETREARWVRSSDNMESSEVPPASNGASLPMAAPSTTPQDPGDSQDANTPESTPPDMQEEVAPVPFLGLRIPGVRKTGALGESSMDLGSNDGAANMDKPAILVYNEGASEPKVTTLDSPAGPQTPFIAIFTMASRTEVEVTLYTWQRSEGEEEKEVAGKWHKASLTVGTGGNTRDLVISMSNCRPKTSKVYGSSSAKVFTVKDNACNETQPELVAIYPSLSPSQNTSGEDTSGEIADSGSATNESVGGDNALESVG